MDGLVGGGWRAIFIDFGAMDDDGQCVPEKDGKSFCRAKRWKKQARTSQDDVKFCKKISEFFGAYTVVVGVGRGRRWRLCRG